VKSVNRVKNINLLRWAFELHISSVD